MKKYLIKMNRNIRFIIACSVIFSIMSCSRESKKKEDASIIKFEKTVYDFKNIFINNPKSTLFNFSNISNTSLVINDVITSCSCTVAEWNKSTVGIKQKGVIKITYTPSTIGPFVNIIDVYYNGKTVPQKILIKGVVLTEK